ncbi:MAG: hypothetical protein IJF73_00200 [Clostridia bacterium]|nr:hypothetical protein [Clostridia bacterium]
MKKALSFLLAVLFLASLSSCGKRPGGSATALLGEFLAEGAPPPAGAVYASVSVPGGEHRPLSEALVAALYARADGTCEYAAAVEEAAVYLSHRADAPFEAAVFLCYGSADTEAVAAMCLRRVRLLMQSGRADAAGALIECRGRAVYFLIRGK